jgi:hypothetical protein
MGQPEIRWHSPAGRLMKLLLLSAALAAIGVTVVAHAADMPTKALLMSVKWKFVKTVFRYAVNSPDPAIQSGYIKSQFPMMYDLSSDPHEDNNLSYTDLTNGALLASALKAIAEYERSVKQYPNIKVGEDFKGYKK